MLLSLTPLYITFLLFAFYVLAYCVAFLFVSKLCFETNIVLRPTLGRNLAVFARSAITPPTVNRFRWSHFARTTSLCRRAYILPLLFFLSFFFISFQRLISDVTERISTKLGHIFTYDCYLKNLVQTPRAFRVGTFPVRSVHPKGKTLNWF